MLCSTYDISDLQAFNGLDPLEQGQGQSRLNFIVHMGLPSGTPLTEIMYDVTYIAHISASPYTAALLILLLTMLTCCFHKKLELSEGHLDI